MEVVFDTNVFRDVQRGVISAKDFQKAKDKLGEEGATGCFSPLSLIEIGSHITSESAATFCVYRTALAVSRELCQGTLPEPDSFLRKVLFNAEKLRPGIPPEETEAIRDEIIRASSFSDLVAGRRIKGADGALYETKYDSEFLRQFRTEYEERFVKKMNMHVRDLLIPDAEERKRVGMRPEMPEGPGRDKVIGFIYSERFADMLYRSQAERFGITLIGEAPSWDREARAMLDAFINGYRWILKTVVESGYNIRKHKNDFNDLHFLLYLARDNLLLVTSDGGFNRKLMGTSSQAERVKSFSEWLST